MPTYEYECSRCSKLTSALRSVCDRFLPLSCPFCGANTSLVLSIFSISHNRNSNHVSTGPSSRPTGVRFESSTSATFRGCHFENLKTGIDAPADAMLDIDGCTFSNVEQPLKIRDE